MHKKFLTLYKKAEELLENLKNHRIQLEKLTENFIQKEHRDQLKVKIKKVEDLLYRL